MSATVNSISGTGQINDPIARGGIGCAYKGCPETGVYVRITEGGHAVRYCRGHEREAADTFDRDDDFDPYAEVRSGANEQL